MLNGLVRLMEDCDGSERPKGVAQRRRMWESMSPAQQRELSDMVGLARDGRERLLSMYAHPYIHALRTESRIGTTLNPFFLISLAGACGDDSMSKRVRFEATSIFDLAQMLVWVENRRGESRYTVGEDMASLIDFFTGSLFEDKSRTSVRVFTYHDPADHFRVREVGVDKSLQGHPPNHVLEHLLSCRTFGGGRLVFLDHRPKGLFETALKMLKQFRAGKKAWHRISDRRGIKLIVPTVEDVHTLMETLGTLMPVFNGRFIPGQSNITGNGTVRMSKSNSHSSPMFKAAKCELWYRDRVFEVLIATFQDHFSSLYATDKVNHELYRLDQALDIYLPRLCPARVYGVDWKSEKVREPLLSQVCERLLWRFRHAGQS